MGDFAFNIAKGRAAAYYDNVDNNSPANSAIIVVLINTTETDTNLKRLDTLAAIEANANTAELTNSGYARQVLTDAQISAATPDDTNDRQDLDVPDVTFPAVAAGTNATDVLFCYDPDTTGGTDSAIIPLSCHDYPATTDGADLVVQIAAAGFYRAA